VVAASKGGTGRSLQPNHSIVKPQPISNAKLIMRSRSMDGSRRWPVFSFSFYILHCLLTLRHRLAVHIEQSGLYRAHVREDRSRASAPIVARVPGCAWSANRSASNATSRAEQESTRRPPPAIRPGVVITGRPAAGLGRHLGAPRPASEDKHDASASARRSLANPPAVVPSDRGNSPGGPHLVVPIPELTQPRKPELPRFQEVSMPFRRHTCPTNA
jgi:hypothetical protein